MKKNIQLLFLTILFSNDPPIAKQIPHQIQIHNQTRIDNYYWMNQKGDDWVLNYLNEENQYRDKVLANTTQLHKELYNEMINRLPDYENSVPYIHNNYEYRKIFLKGNDYEIYQRRLVTKKNREWNDILDINELAREFEYADVGWIQPSPNNQYLAFGIDTQGNYRYFIKILNLVTGELLKENIPNTWGKCVWHPDNNRIFYSEKDYTNRNLCIKQHWIGFNNLDDEELIFEEIDTQYSVYLSQSKSGRYMFIGSESTNATDFSFIDLQDKNLKINNISNRKKYHLYYPIQYEKSFYILTNSKNHTENKIVSTLISNPGVQYWKNLFIPEEGHTFENFTIINDHIIIKARHNVNPYFQITNLKNDSTFTIKFKEKLFYLGFKDNYDKDAKHFRFEYSSPTTPQIIYDYDLENYELISKYKRQLNNNFSSNNYNIERHSVMDKSNSNSKPRKGRRFKIPSILTKDVFLMIYCAGVGFAVMQYFSNNELYNFLSIRELEHIPLMMSFLWVGNAFGCILSGFLIDRYGCYLDILRYYAMFAFVGILGILFLKAKWYFFLPFFFCLGIPASGYVVVVSYFNKYLSSTNGSSAVSLMDFFGGLACLIIPALMGMIFQYTVYLGPLNVQVYQHIFLVLVPIITLPLFIKLKP